MNLPALILLSFAISTDAFAAALVQGGQVQNTSSDGKKSPTPSVLLALKTGLIFGMTEAIMPLFGYFLGVLAEDWIRHFDHWVSFILLGGLGCHVLYRVLFGGDTADIPKVPSHQISKFTRYKTTILTAIATSIDAMVIGVGLAFARVDIWLACFLIGVITTLMAMLGVYFGAMFHAKIGKVAEIAGGLILIAIGVFILYSHLTAG